jgi:predicted nucleic acid-binding protein
VSLIVLDASVLTAFYAADDPRRIQVAARLAAGHTLFAPAHLDVEVVSALRGIARRSPILRSAAPAALHHLAGLPIQRMALAPLLERIWHLRDNVSAYDAAYVALAERLSCPLLTCDGKLARATGLQCTIELIS